MVEGSIEVSSGEKWNPIACRGYLICICPGDEDYAIIVLEKSGGKVPCICPLIILDEAAVKALKEYMETLSDARKDMFGRSFESIFITSTPARRGDVDGHILLSGPQRLIGRAVDTKMLAALKGGCIRIGKHSSKAIYTMDRLYTPMRPDKLWDVAHAIVPSHSGNRLCSACRSDTEKFVHAGEWIISSQLQFHETWLEALGALNDASNLPKPSLDECLLQIALGGDPDLMMVGKFLPCKGRCTNPDIKIQCVCGFLAGDKGIVPKHIARKKCAKKSTR